MDLFASMTEVRQVKCVMDLPGGVRLLHTHEGHARHLAARVKFEHHRLDGAFLHLAILESNREGRNTMNHCAFLREQMAGPFLRTGHEWFLVSIKHKN